VDKVGRSKNGGKEMANLFGKGLHRDILGKERRRGRTEKTRGVGKREEEEREAAGLRFRCPQKGKTLTKKTGVGESTITAKPQKKDRGGKLLEKYPKNQKDSGRKD